VWITKSEDDNELNTVDTITKEKELHHHHQHNFTITSIVSLCPLNASLTKPLSSFVLIMGDLSDVGCRLP
jgi:hypothetical protein